MQEVSVQWHEVAGSKLNLATATMGMVWDLVVMRFSWAVGRWSVHDGRKEWERWREERSRAEGVNRNENGAGAGEKDGEEDEY